MGTILSTILITAPLAFIAGWLICKALFESMRVTSPRRHTPEQETDKNAGDKPASPPELQAAPAELQTMLKQLAQARADKKVLANELVLMKEAVAERDHRVQELTMRLAETALPPEDASIDIDTISNIKISKEMRALQNRIDEQKHEIAELRHENISAEKRLEGAGRRFSLWRSRFKPLIKRVRQQHMIMSELREELRLREQTGSAPQLQAVTETPAMVTAVEPVAETVASNHEESPPPVEVQPVPDELRAIRGIGPALERKLQDTGIYSLRQLAEMTADEMLKLGRELGVSKKQLEKHDWTQQAREILGLPTGDASETPAINADAVNA